MRKLLMVCALLCGFLTGASAQQEEEIYNEVKRLMTLSEAQAADKSRGLEERKVACFKYDALYYLLEKGGQTEGFTVIELGTQANALLEFVNLYVKKLAEAKNKKERELVMARFKGATTGNALFNDMDKEMVYAYVDNPGYITQFSIDTNWVSALEEVKAK